MAVTYKDIDLLTQKSAVVGTEKLPVSDTEYITPDQIAGLTEVDDELSRTSTNPVQNKIVTLARIDIEELTPTSTVTGKYIKRSDGTEYEANSYNYRLFNVSPGQLYAVSSAFSSGYSTGTIRAVVFLDANGAVVGYSQFGTVSGETAIYVNRLIPAPYGAVTAAVNYRPSFAWAGKLGLVANETNAYVGSFAQTLTTDEQAQARTNIGAAATSDIPTDLSDLSDDATHRFVTDTEKSTWNGKQNAITVSSSEPTSSQGSDGDIWIVV